ncbi:MAG: prephenate dehydrogenase [Cytophagales bacterium]|nr:prephenate dehydrogenase [Cytophagales bacterium]
MNICVVGLGLLGGSFSLAIQKVHKRARIIGVDRNTAHANKALELGIAHEIESFETGVAKADLVILATPMNVMVEQIQPALDHIQDRAIVVDLGSTKKDICEACVSHPKRGRYVALHPIAGTENSGPEAAFGELMEGKMMILCDTEKCDADALQYIELMMQALQMNISYMNSTEHDLHIAYVSHLSHISSFALGLTVLEKEKNEKNIFAMAGSGFSSTVRIAKSSPEMWAPIFEQNAGNISEALEAYIQKLKEFKDIIDERAKEKSLKEMRKANEIRRVLQGIPQ